jgi:hypothetical protein
VGRGGSGVGRGRGRGRGRGHGRLARRGVGCLAWKSYDGTSPSRSSRFAPRSAAPAPAAAPHPAPAMPPPMAPRAVAPDRAAGQGARGLPHPAAAARDQAAAAAAAAAATRADWLSSHRTTRLRARASPTRPAVLRSRPALRTPVALPWSRASTPALRLARTAARTPADRPTAPRHRASTSSTPLPTAAGLRTPAGPLRASGRS